MFYCFSTILMVHLVIFNVIIQACEHLRFIEVKPLKIQNHSPFHTSQLWFDLLKYFGFSSEVTAYGREMLQSNGTWEKRDTPGCMFCIHWDFAGLSLSLLAPMIWGLWSFFYGLAQNLELLPLLTLSASTTTKLRAMSQPGWSSNVSWCLKIKWLLAHKSTYFPYFSATAITLFKSSLELHVLTSCF